MSESISIPAEVTDKKSKYEILLPQIYALVDGETDWLSCVANIVAALKDGMDFFWIGTYRVLDNELLLGPFQGPVACLRIGYGKGVCGASWKENKTIIVPDVELFPGHIACNSLSRSEIVVPVRKNGNVVMVLDVDSTRLNDFDAVDAFYLEKVADLMARFV
jgi:L-methionine (R)-S-oxide reductase